MHQLVRTVFSKLHDLDPESEEKKLLTTPPPGIDQPPPPTDQSSGDGTTASQQVTPIVQSPPDVSRIPKSGCMSLLFPSILCSGIDLCLRWTALDR